MISLVVHDQMRLYVEMKWQIGENAIAEAQG